MPEPRAALLVWGALGLAGCAWGIAQHARLAARLAGRSVVDRGAMAVADGDGFLATAGRVRLRERLASGQAEVASLGAAWSWVLVHRPEGAPRALVYLNLPHTVLYYYTRFYWWPHEVRVNPQPGLVKDTPTLEAHAMRIASDSFDTLRPLGYTHVIDVGGPDGVRLVPLR
jgi:hypothetical protein